MADIVFGEDLPSWLATKSLARRFVQGFFSSVPGISLETDTAFARTAVSTSVFASESDTAFALSALSVNRFGAETDLAYALLVKLFPPVRRTAVLPTSSFQNRTATLVP
jgi:hypothetical protein